MSGFASIDIAQRALQAHRTVLEIIGHNIANASTPGYTRRVAELAPTFTEHSRFGSVGSGVEVSRIARKRAIYLDGRFRSEQAAVGEYGVLSAYLASVEGVLGEPGDDGIGAALDDFFAGWSELAGDPTEPAHKQELVSRAERLAGAIRRARGGFQEEMERADEELVVRVGEVNDILRQVAELNGQIHQQEIGGTEAPDLRDRRDHLLNQLSALAPVRISENADGLVSVWLAGRTLVDATTARELQADTVLRDGVRLHRVRVEGQGRDVVFEGGALGALQSLRDETLTGYVAELDRLAASLITRVNALHEQGFRGLSFFTGESAADMAVNGMLTDDPNNVDASTTSRPGDNDLALQLAALQDQQVAEVRGQTYSGFYRALVVRVGGETAAAKFGLEARQATLSQVQSQKEAVEAVSLDEEMAQMITTEHAYEAAARLMATASEMLEALLSMV